MQKEKTLKFLTFVFGLATLISVSEISANQISASVTNADITVTGFRNLSAGVQASDKISIIGTNFGIEAKDLKVFLNKQQYSVEASSGNEAIFKLDKKMQSGDLFVERTIKLANGSNTKIDSKPIFLNLNEPSITKMDAPNGLLPGANLDVRGKNLSGASFFCSNQTNASALAVKEQTAVSATLTLPNQFAECTPIVRNRGFESATNQKLQISAPINVTGISFVDGGFRVDGKNFSIFENKLSSLTLIFEGKKLNSATLLADGSLFFAKNQNNILPNTGWVALAVGDKTSPRFDYHISDNFPKIASISNLYDEENGKTNFQISVGDTASELTTSKLFLNGKAALSFSNSVANFDGRPVLSGKAWFEKDGWQSEIFNYEFKENLEPAITKIQVNMATRSLEISGQNFGTSRDKFNVKGLQFKDPDSTTKSKSTDTKTWLQRLSLNTAIVQLPFSTGDLSVSVSNRWGTSNSVKITLPLESSQAFFPDFSISSIEPLEGLAPGKRFIVHGKNLLGATLANIGGKQITTKALTVDRTEITIPPNAPLAGEIFLSSRNGSKNSSIAYKLTSADQINNPLVEFPVNTDKATLTQSDAWQNLFDFALTNNLKTITLDSLEFNFNQTLLPLTDFRIVDDSGSSVADARVEISLSSRKLKIRNLKIDPSLEKKHFTLQTKVFRDLAENKKIIFSLGSSTERNNQKINSSKTTKEISIIGNSGTEKLCIALIDKQWKSCKMQRPTNDLVRRNRN